VDRLAVRMREELKEPEAALQSGRAIAESPLHAMPEREMVVNQRDDADAKNALAERLTAAQIGREAEIDHEGYKPP